MIWNLVFLLILTGCTPPAQTTGSENKSNTNINKVVNVKDFGAKGNGSTNDYLAIQKAIAELHRLGSGTLFFPSGIYNVDEVMRRNELGKKLSTIDHFYFKGLNNIAIRGEEGSVISIKGDFHKKSDWVLKDRDYHYSFSQQVSFVFIGCRNIIIENLEVDGNCDKMTRLPKVVENFSFGFIFGESITDFNENVTMRNCYIHHISTDAVSWKGKGGNFYGENLVLKNNGRCAMSIVQGKNMRFVNCDFSESGVTGKYVSHSPNTGVDIENESFFTIEDIYFKNCRFIKNMNTQFVATGFDGVGAGRTKNVHLDSCYFEENREIEPVRDRAVMITTDNSSITNSTIIGTLNFDLNGCTVNGQPDKGVLIKNCKIRSRGHGIRLNCDLKVKIEDCEIDQFPNLDEESAKLNYPFIGGGPNVVIEDNTFIYQASNWRKGHETIAWDLNNYLQGGKSVSGNTFMLKDENSKMPKDATFIIMIDEKFLEKNKIKGTNKIVFTLY